MSVITQRLVLPAPHIARPGWRKLLLICGIIAPLMYAASDLVAGINWDGYSFRDQTISELNAWESQSRTITVVLGIVGYTFLTAFGIGIWGSSAGNRRLRVVGAVMTVLGVTAIPGVTFASMHVRGVEQGTAGAIHLGTGMVALLLLITAMGLAGSTLGRRFRMYTIATSVALLAFGVWAGIASANLAEGAETPWLGAIERISVYSYQLWIVVLAVALWRRESAAGKTNGGKAASP